MSSAGFDVVVFDFDGVILDSADVKTEAFCDLYADHGADVVAKVREHHLANLGISRFKKFEWIAANVLRADLTPESRERLSNRFTELALERVLAAPFIRGAREALSTLQVPLFVASGTPEEELKMIIERRGIASYFREVHGSPREKPDILRDLIARHGFATERVLFVGDGMSDYKAAKAVGVPFLARDTPQLHDEWVASGVRLMPDLTALPALVS